LSLSKGRVSKSLLDRERVGGDRRDHAGEPGIDLAELGDVEVDGASGGCGDCRKNKGKGANHYANSEEVRAVYRMICRQASIPRIFNGLTANLGPSRMQDPGRHPGYNV
jgi:hypothetical protein